MRRRKVLPWMLLRMVLTGAVVASVFLMHGPAAVAGCPGGEPAEHGSMIVAATRPPTAAITPSVNDGGLATGRLQALAANPHDMAGHGQVCVSRPPGPRFIERPGSLLPALAQALVSEAGALAVAGLPRRRRAPPLFGAALLTHLCVWRT